MENSSAYCLPKSKSSVSVEPTSDFFMVGLNGRAGLGSEKSGYRKGKAVS